MYSSKDTIFALATPTGKSAIAVIRLSGSKSFKIISKISVNFPKEINKATINKLIDDKKNILDKTITTIFKSPKSYTGENMVEISIHGGGAVIKKILETINSNKNARMAEPGEFTRRAFENNKLDLTQVEAISDLVDSQTEAQRKQALNQLGGLLKNKTETWSKKILKILADVEAAIDFTDEELPKNLIKKTKEQIKNIYKNIESSIKKNTYGEKIRSGFSVGIIGKPNTGKSSFINAIAKREIAIVTDDPGTTRDVIELFVDYKGFPIIFSDTAGIRKSKIKAEKIGVKKTIEVAKKADLNLVFIDKYNEIKTYDEIQKKIYVQSKIDINKKIKGKKSDKIRYISSKNNTGIAKLLEEISKKILPDIGLEEVHVSRERHKKIINKTVEILKESIKNKNIDLFAEDIRQAHNEISKITGKKDVEDVLDIIFSDFCIGK